LIDRFTTATRDAAALSRDLHDALARAERLNRDSAARNVHTVTAGSRRVPSRQLPIMPSPDVGDASAAPLRDASPPPAVEAAGGVTVPQQRILCLTS